MTLELIIGAGVTYFVVLYKILKAELDLEQQGSLFNFQCICGKQLFFSHTSTVQCDKCKTDYEIKVEKNKLIVKGILKEGERLFECIDCHNKFICPKGTDMIVKCPSCPRKYYVNGDFVKPIKRRKWW